MIELTPDERTVLAYYARMQAHNQTDPRYWIPNPVERERVRRRWADIADALDATGTETAA